MPQACSVCATRTVPPPGNDARPALYMYHRVSRSIAWGGYGRLETEPSRRPVQPSFPARRPASLLRGGCVSTLIGSSGLLPCFCSLVHTTCRSRTLTLTLTKVRVRVS